MLDHPGIDGLMPISNKHDFILSGRRSCAFREIRHSTRALAVGPGVSDDYFLFNRFLYRQSPC
jgi:hypothetical protein